MTSHDAFVVFVTLLLSALPFGYSAPGTFGRLGFPGSKELPGNNNSPLYGQWSLTLMNDKPIKRGRSTLDSKGVPTLGFGVLSNMKKFFNDLKTNLDAPVHLSNFPSNNSFQEGLQDVLMKDSGDLDSSLDLMDTFLPNFEDEEFSPVIRRFLLGGPHGPYGHSRLGK